eukprot:TRINITY_DN21713_c0_g1_i1.p2 TRINITY_DN21713_c0_g1~~TRINITY_DN21713_c0_g1_i1.p2  ORF type:complete len:317 (-),score=75.17 TRINITY_DN21713_c0_g1_i1:5-955(-)
MGEVRNPPPPMNTWTCVTVGEKDADGNWGDARFEVLVSDDNSHNEIKEVGSEMIHVYLGSSVEMQERRRGRKGGAKGPGAKGESQDRGKALRERAERANIELVGFFRDLFEASEEQVKIESSTKKTKIVRISGLNRERRTIQWFLQSKIGKKYEAHWAADFVKASARENNPETLQRKRELDDFEAERAQVAKRAAGQGSRNALSLQASSTLGSGGHAALAKLGLAVKKSSGKDAAAEDVIPESKLDKNAPAAIQTHAPPEDSAQLRDSVDPAGLDQSDKHATAVGDADTNLGGLMQYDSESSDEEEDADKLANPFN